MTKQQKYYVTPSATVITMMGESRLLATSGESSNMPSANFMENPDVGEDDPDSQQQ